MKVVALLSGGKDSLYNLYLATQKGHEVVAIANLHPPKDKQTDELDSYMYQTVGHQAIEFIAEALEKPLYRREIHGSAKNTDLNYTSGDKDDEVEALYELLVEIRDVHKIDYKAVSVGAIASTYQSTRVEDICKRLGIEMLAYLWNQNQDSLLQRMIDDNFHAILIKVACIGLGKDDIGKSLKEMQDKLRKISAEYGAHICGEGGEFESLVLDCPLFKKKLILDSYEIICHSEDVFAPVYFMRPTKIHLENKFYSADDNRIHNRKD